MMEIEAKIVARIRMVLEEARWEDRGEGTGRVVLGEDVTEGDIALLLTGLDRAARIHTMTGGRL